MASGWAAFRPKGTVVLRLGNSVVTAHCSKMRMVLIRPRITRYHSLAHSILYPNKNIRSFVDHYVDAPLDILRLEGKMKNNLALLLSFTGKTGLSPLSGLEPDQLVLYNLLRFNREEWHDLLRYDIETFTRLESFLGADASQKAGFGPQTRALLRILRPRQPSGGGSEDEHGGPDACALASFTVGLHREFCEDSKIDTDLDAKMQAYSNMIECIRENKTPGALCEEIPFYNEIYLINDFILSCGDPAYFNFDLLEIEYQTPNEALVKQFVVEGIGRKR